MAEIQDPGLRYAPGYVHCDAHPDHGEPVVYTPGQLLPEWVRADLAAGAPLVAEATGSSTSARSPGRPAGEPADLRSLRGRAHRRAIPERPVYRA